MCIVGSSAKEAIVDILKPSAAASSSRVRFAASGLKEEAFHAAHRENFQEPLAPRRKRRRGGRSIGGVPWKIHVPAGLGRSGTASPAGRLSARADRCATPSEGPRLAVIPEGTEEVENSGGRRLKNEVAVRSLAVG